MMETPAQEQQVTHRETDLEDALSAEFDRIASEDEAENEETAEDVTEDVTAEDTEEASEQEISDDAEEISEEETWDEPAPERWPDEIKETYNSLPVEARKAMLEGIFKPMQRTYTQTTQELSEMRKQMEPLLETMNQYRPDFERIGMSPDEALRRQMAWASHFARVGPEQGLKDMQASYGMNQNPSGQQEEEYLTPVERAMKQRLDQLEQGFGQIGQQRQTDLQQAQNEALTNRYNEVQSGLQAFMNEQKDGKAAHPHLEKVAPAVAGLIRGGLVQQSDEYGQPVPIRDQMAQAYKMACDLDPSIRSASQTGQVARAKSAQDVDVVTKLPSEMPDAEEMTIEELLNAEYDRQIRRAG